jgi:hypothetical protein
MSWPFNTRTCTESQQAFHVEAIGFKINTMGTTLSTFADRLKLFSLFQNRPQFILLPPPLVTRAGPGHWNGSLEL